MKDKFEIFLDRFIDLIDQKYKDSILETASHWETMGHKHYGSLKEAKEDHDYFCVSDALTDLSVEYIYDFYEYDEETKEAIIFVKLAHQIISYKKGNPEIFITEEDYEWIKNAPSRDECIERDKKRRGIIDNKRNCSDDFVPPT